VESRAFPLRPAPQAGVPFRGTYREAGWKRCAQMSEGDGITFTPWPHAAMPGWSLPALEAAHCVAKQGAAAFERVHLALYEAYFTQSRDIGDRDEVTRIVVEAAGVDAARFREDYAAAVARDEVLAEYETAVTEHGVRAIPTVVVPATGRALVGLATLEQYRAAVEEAAA
jgi:predicted DsbA family dithiol-disulfide isomerase